MVVMRTRQTLGSLQLRWMRPQCLTFLLGVAIALLCTVVLTPIGNAQDSPDPAADSLPAKELPSPAETIIEPFEKLAPPEVKSFFESEAVSQVQLAPIYLDGRVLLSVTAPADGDEQAAAARAREIEQRLSAIAQGLVETGNIEQLAVTYTLDAASNQPVIAVNDEMLMTVTFLDAQFSGVNNLSLRTAQIVRDIRDGLNRYHQERQPTFLWQRLRWALAIVLATLLGSFALDFRRQRLRQRCQRLQRGEEDTPIDEEGIAAAPVDPAVHTMQTMLLTQQRIKGLRILRQLLRVGQVALWSGSSFVILGLFPYTRWLQPLILKVLRLPVRFLLIVLAAYGLTRLVDIWIDRLFLAIQTQAGLTLERSRRLTLRLSTFSQVIKGIVVVIICLATLLIVLTQVGVQVAPILTGAGLVGVAISFASQNLIKDIINGFLILLEDQYGVGDVITVRSVSGFVEKMNLRITQLRDTEGKLITVPNGQIDVVQNLSKEWSRADLLVAVGWDADINRALELVEQVACEMHQDTVWGVLILEPPLLLGVDHLDHVGSTIRLWIKTQPLKQWDVAREYRRRLQITFAKNHIPVGIPQQIVQVNGARGTSSLPHQATPSNHHSGATSLVDQPPINAQV